MIRSKDGSSRATATNSPGATGPTKAGRGRERGVSIKDGANNPATLRFVFTVVPAKARIQDFA